MKKKINTAGACFKGAFNSQILKVFSPANLKGESSHEGEQRACRSSNGFKTGHLNGFYRCYLELLFESEQEKKILKYLKSMMETTN